MTANAEMLSQLNLARSLASRSEPILVSGPTGSGKELFAQYIHAYSARRSVRFVNCAAIPGDLFESEFFGHAKGAFTGADKPHVGYFAQANHGTLVLDEVSELELTFQAKLLRAIENQEIQPLGSQQVIKLDTRIIALTNKDLRIQIDNGQFREDLFHRLNFHSIDLLPLSRRPEDIRLLAEHFVEKSWLGLMPNWRSIVSTTLIDKLCQHHFSGNVRDLRNVVRKVIDRINARDPTINPELVDSVLAPYQFAGNSCPNETLDEMMTRVLRSRILEVLKKHNFHLTNAAKELGTTRQRLKYQIKRLEKTGMWST